jgi:hypothetical protein
MPERLGVGATGCGSGYPGSRARDGCVLVVGGSVGQSGFTRAELCDPASGTWSSIDDMTGRGKTTNSAAPESRSATVTRLRRG